MSVVRDSTMTNWALSGTAWSHFFGTPHKCSAVETCFNADTHSQPAPDQRSSSTPAGGQLHPPHLAAIFHPSCWQSNSPLPTQRSSSTPAGCSSKPHPFPPSVHLPPFMLEVNFTFPPAIGVQGEGGDEQGRRKSGDERPEMRDERRELKDERQEMWEGKRETGVGLGRHVAEDVRWETGDRRREKW